jgi:hypothetical protein
MGNKQGNEPWPFRPVDLLTHKSDGLKRLRWGRLVQNYYFQERSNRLRVVEIYAICTVKYSTFEGIDLFSPGCICFLYFTCISEIFKFKKFQRKILQVDLHILRAHEVVLRKTVFFCVAYVKRQKLVLKQAFFTIFCIAHKKYQFFTKL